MVLVEVLELLGPAVMASPRVLLVPDVTGGSTPLSVGTTPDLTVEVKVTENRSAGSQICRQRLYSRGQTVVLIATTEVVKGQSVTSGPQLSTVTYEVLSTVDMETAGNSCTTATWVTVAPSSVAVSKGRWMKWKAGVILTGGLDGSQRAGGGDGDRLELHLAGGVVVVRMLIVWKSLLELKLPWIAEAKESCKSRVVVSRGGRGLGWGCCCCVNSEGEEEPSCGVKWAPVTQADGNGGRGRAGKSVKRVPSSFASERPACEGRGPMRGEPGRRRCIHVQSVDDENRATRLPACSHVRCAPIQDTCMCTMVKQTIRGRLLSRWRVISSSTVESTPTPDRGLTSSSMVN